MMMNMRSQKSCWAHGEGLEQQSGQERKYSSSCSSSSRRRSGFSPDESKSTASAGRSSQNHSNCDASVSSTRKTSTLAAANNKPHRSCIGWFAFHQKDQGFRNQDISGDHQIPHQSSMISRNRNSVRCSNGNGAPENRRIVIFTISEIMRATSNFSASKIIGEGKFGIVYKGVLNNRTEVAVKCAKKDIYNNMHVPPDFENEILTLSRVDHFNLVRFYGFLQKDGEQIIVSEYVSNGNLRQNLTGSHGERLGIGERIQIAIDVAAAVTYLHTYAGQKIIHRDVKASNILITKNNRAKVADFGFARLIDDDLQSTYITTGIKGTEGYLDPEYHKTYRLTERSDVYSFGVLLVELVTGLPPIVIDMKKNRKRNNTERAMKNYRDGNLHLVMDRRLGEAKMVMGVAGKMLGLAERCTAPTRDVRPSMKECGEMLWKIRTELQKVQREMSRRSSSYGFESQSLEEPSPSASRVSSSYCYSAPDGMERHARDALGESCEVSQATTSSYKSQVSRNSVGEEQTRRRGEKKERRHWMHCHIL